MVTKDLEYQWKMSFKPDENKQAQEVLFFRKNKLNTHRPFLFNKFEVKLASFQQHLELNLDCKLSFTEHITDKINKAIKGIGLLRKLQPILPTVVLINYIQIFHMTSDYRNIIYDQPSNKSFLGRIQ